MRDLQISFTRLCDRRSQRLPPTSHLSGNPCNP